MVSNNPLKSKRFLILAVLLIAALIYSAGYLAGRDGYTVYAGEEVLQVSGSYEQVGQVLDAAGIDLRPEDLVQPHPLATADPGVAIQVQFAQPVLLRTEDGADTYWTQQPTLAAFLHEQKVEIQRTDQIFADGRQVPFAQLNEAPLPEQVEIGRFVNATIVDGQQQLEVRSAAQTVGELLQEAGLIIYAADGVEPPLGSWVTPNSTITIRRSMPLTIRVDGRIIQTRSHHHSALDVLAENGIGLIGQDFTRPGPEIELQPRDTIQVVRVSEDFRIEDEPIPYQSLLQPTDQLELDQRAVLQSGIPGILRRRIRVRYENGVEVSQTPDGEWVASEPVNEIVGYGTRIVVRVVEGPDGAYEYWRVVRMRVTSYTAASSGKPPDHPAYGITASGLRAGTGIVAVDRDIVPFRSWVYVPGYGTGFAGDTGGGVIGRWIDLGYDEDEFVSWSGYVDVYYLTPVPEPEQINYLLPTWLP